MILGIIVAQMATRGDILLKHQLLRREIGLRVEEMVTTTTGLSLRMLRASTLGREASQRPKATLADNLFHSLEPPQISGVVFWEVERLSFACQGIDTIAHAWPLWVVCPETFGIWRDVDKTKKDQLKRGCTFDHLGGREGIISMLQVTGCIIEQEEALGRAICLALKDVDHTIDLGNELLCIEISITILPWSEHDVGLSEE